MDGAILDAARSAMASPWIYLLILAIACFDSFVPVLPSEALVITAGVFSATDRNPTLWLLIVVAAAGAFLGDHVAYFIGRWAHGPIGRWLERGPRRQASISWARGLIQRRGGMILVVGRYVPGGRTAITLTMGITEYPLRRFSPADAVAAGSWSIYASMIGFLGGQAFEDNPLYGLALGLGIALAISGIVELVRKLRARSRRRNSAEDAGTAVGSSWN